MTRSILLAALTLSAVSASAEPATRVFLNGVPAPVYFNDGDSFRVLGGQYAGTKARLAGFNTLESYGPVHQWGDWHAKELYFLAKMGTYNAARGVWHCETDGETDTYDRILWWCKDLAVDQVRRGLAHAMTVTDDPADPDVVAAQQDAIKNKRGIWAHGVPKFVLTSTHSASEGGGSDGRTYNRLVSSADGHSEKWMHNDNYSECQKVCHVAKVLPDDVVARIAGKLKADTDAKVLIGYMTPDQLTMRIKRFVANGSVGYMDVKEDALALDVALGRLAAADLGAATAGEENSCVIHVDFRRRYGGKKAKCLK